MELVRAAVAVVITADRPVLLLMRRFRDTRGSGRARDVGDRCDVIPVDAMPEAEGQTGHEHADPGGGAGCNEQDVEHAVILSPGAV
jgi:hypothetical protein